MVKLTSSETRSSFRETINRIRYQGVRVLVHSRGKPLAALVSVEDLERLEALEDAEDNAVADAAVAEAERDGWSSLEDVKREFGIK